MDELAIPTQTGVPAGGSPIAQNASGGSALGTFTQVLRGFLGGEQAADAAGQAQAGGLLPRQFLEGQDGEAGLVEVLPGIFVPANPQAAAATANGALALGAAPGQNAANAAQGVVTATGGPPSAAAAGRAKSPLGAVHAEGAQSGGAASVVAPGTTPAGATTGDTKTPRAAGETEIFPTTPTSTGTLVDAATADPAATVAPAAAEAAIRSAAQNVDIEAGNQVAARPADDGENAKASRQTRLGLAAMAAANTARAGAAAAPTQPDTGKPEPVQTVSTASAADPTTPNDPVPAKVSPLARAATPADVSDQIAVRIHKAASEGADRITIRLHPPSLGRVEVKLEIGHEGRLTATLVAEKSHTLDMLQRDSRGLHQALQDAGLKTDSGSLSFHLRGEGEQHSAFAREMQTTATLNDGGEPGDSALADASQHRAQADSARTGLLDIHV